MKKFLPLRKEKAGPLQTKKKRKRILAADISFISLCESGANNFHTVLKSMKPTDEKKDFSFTSVAKMDDKEGVLWSLAYAPEMEDLQGDIADKSVVKEMAYSFARNKGSIDIKHNNIPVRQDEAYIVESFITTPADKDRPAFKGLTTYDGKPVNFDGAWAVAIKLESPSLRELYATEHNAWNGISMGGAMWAEEEEVDHQASLLESLKSWYEKNFKGAEKDLPAKPNNQKKEMTDEEIKKLVADSVAESVKAVVGELNKQAPKDPEPQEEPKKVEKAIEFEGDPTNKEDLLKHQVKLLKATADFSTVEGVASYQEALQKLAEGKQPVAKKEAAKSNIFGDFSASAVAPKKEDARKAAFDSDAEAFHKFQDTLKA